MSQSEIFNVEPTLRFEPRFGDWWELYDKKVGRQNCEKKWRKMSTTEKWAAMEHTPIYVASTSDKQYRKNPLSYINQKGWEDEIIKNGKQERSTEYLQAIISDTSI